MHLEFIQDLETLKIYHIHRLVNKVTEILSKSYLPTKNLTLLHSEWPKLYGVLATRSATGLKKSNKSKYHDSQYAYLYLYYGSFLNKFLNPKNHLSVFLFNSQPKCSVWELNQFHTYNGHSVV